MSLSRRRALSLIGASIGATGTAGCLGNGDGMADPTPDGDADRTLTETATPARDPAVAGTETIPYTVRTDQRSEWRENDGATGRVVVIDGHERARATLRLFETDAIDEDAVRALLEDLDYERERLVLIRSAGPDECHASVEVEDVRVEGGHLRASAAVVDESDPDENCAAVVTAPETLLRVTFEDDPTDEVAIEVTDGWGETATVTASTDDPLAPEPGDLEGHVAPEGDPDPVTPLACEDADFERHYRGYENGSVHLGESRADGTPTFALRVAETAYERGDTVTITLTSLADEIVPTGNADKYNVEVYTEEGWQDVRGGDRQYPYTDEGIVHAPGGGFEWRFDLTEDGVVADAPHDLRVCPGLPAGRYRFAYWGVGSDALAVEFDLSE